MLDEMIYERKPHVSIFFHFLLLNIFPNKCTGSLEEKIKKYKMENEERKLSNMGFRILRL